MNCRKLRGGLTPDECKPCQDAWIEAARIGRSLKRMLTVRPGALRSYVMSMSPTGGFQGARSKLSSIPVDPVGGCLMVAKTKCPDCGKAVSHEREHGRAARRRTYCTTRCRRRAERTRAWNARSAIAARTAVISGPEGTSTEGGRKATHNPLKLLADNSGKSRSRGRFLAWRQRL